jgi:hypothetical protein
MMNNGNPVITIDGKMGQEFFLLKKTGPKDRQITTDILEWVGLAHKEWGD